MNVFFKILSQINLFLILLNLLIFFFNEILDYEIIILDFYINNLSDFLLEENESKVYEDCNNVKESLHVYYYCEDIKKNYIKIMKRY